VADLLVAASFAQGGFLPPTQQLPWKPEEFVVQEPPLLDGSRPDPVASPAEKGFWVDVQEVRCGERGNRNPRRVNPEGGWGISKQPLIVDHFSLLSGARVMGVAS